MGVELSSQAQLAEQGALVCWAGVIQEGPEKRGGLFRSHCRGEGTELTVRGFRCYVAVGMRSMPAWLLVGKCTEATGLFVASDALQRLLQKRGRADEDARAEPTLCRGLH